MKRFSLIVAIFLSTFSFANAQFVAKRYSVSGIDGIRAGWAFQIELEEGDSKEITIISPTQTAEYVIVKNNNGILTLDLDFTNVTSKSNNPDGITQSGNTIMMSKNRKTLYGPIKVKMQIQRLNAIILSGNAELTTKGSFKGEKITCHLTGNAKINNTKVAIETLSINATGTSNLSFSGSYKDVNIELGGNAQANIVGDYYKGDISEVGASSLVLNGKTNSLNIDLSGSSAIELIGNSQNLHIESSGNSKANCNNFNTRSADLKLNGSSKIDMHILQSLNVKADGASQLNYTFRGDTSNLNIKKGISAIVKTM